MALALTLVLAAVFFAAFFVSRGRGESRWVAYGIHFFAWLGAIALFLAGVFLALPVVAIVAVALLAIKRRSVFLALLALVGGFAVPALLGLTENAWPLFAYLLLLTAGAAWVSYREDWPWLIAVAVPLATVYEWVWVIRSMTVSELPLAAVVFALLAAAGSAPLWFPPKTERSGWFRGAAALAALLPLLFAFYLAAEPNYAQHYNVLFGFLLVVAAGLAAIVLRGGGEWLHAAGGIAVLLTFFLWFAFWLYFLNSGDLLPPVPQRGLVLDVTLWIMLFITLYLVRPAIFAGLIFFAFIGLAMRQPSDAPVMIGGMALILAVVIVVSVRVRRPLYAGIAAVFAMLAVVALRPLDALAPLFPFHAIAAPPPLSLLVAVEWVFFAGLFVVAWRGGLPWLAIVAVALYAGMMATTGGALGTLLLFLLFVAYAFLAETSSEAPFIALLLAGVVLLLTTGSGVVALLIAAVMFSLLLFWWVRGAPLPEPLFAIVASAALGFFNVALALLLPIAWTAVLWSIEAAILAGLAARFASRVTLRVWSVGLASVVFAWITLDSRLYSWIVFVIAGAAMYAAAWLVRTPKLRLLFSLFGLAEHWLLINIVIAQYYRSTGVAFNTSFGFASPREDVTYTIAWAVAATLVMIAGVVLPWRGARVGGASLLILTSLKCFTHDAVRLDDGYRVASLVAVALTFVLVSAILQNFAERRATVAA